MVVALVEVRLSLVGGGRSRVVRSLVDRLRARHQMSAAQIPTRHEDGRVARIGFSWVGSDARAADRAVDEALQTIHTADVVVVGIDREIIHWSLVD